MSYPTTDLCDKYSDVIQVAEPLFADYGGQLAFHGQITTLKLHEDNSLVRSTLETKGNGNVLVVDGGGSTRCALVGDQLAALAVKNNWSGIVVYGCIRDSAAIAEMDIGVKAICTHPLKSNKRGIGEKNVIVKFASVIFKPGAWLYADGDGFIVSENKLSL